MEETFSLSEIDGIAKKVLESINSKIILFYGGLGVGKTTLISAILKELGCDEEVSSPTFSIVNEYELENDVAYHFDFYRIENEEEAHQIGIEEYLYSGHWCFIEWPEKIKGILPDKYDVVELKITAENRIIKL